ncbi:MAG TPA: DUF411 domain-containing protein [Candidatus Limnocylindrales bacterium]|nr:DUF411 domain-containing protein [Candidatus Limnocylindrales bacterium]
MRLIVIVLASLALVVACSPAASDRGWTAPPSESALAPPGRAELVIEVYKSPSCECCHEWEAYLTARGYTVRSVPTDDLSAVKIDHGLPEATWSCHTAVIGGYVVEGHVPVAAIEDLLRDRPAIDAIALPGMPAGSPGMPGTKAGPFEILSVTDGEVALFGSY